MVYLTQMVDGKAVTVQMTDAEAEALEAQWDAEAGKVAQ